MKSILFSFVLALIGINAQSQTIQQGILTFKNGHLADSAGVVLSDDEVIQYIGDADFVDRYVPAVNLHHSGIVLLKASAFYFGAGLVLGCLTYKNADNPGFVMLAAFIVPGIASAGLLGAGTLLLGSFMVIKADRSVYRLAREYNGKYMGKEEMTKLNFGATSDGIGLSLNF